MAKQAKHGLPLNKSVVTLRGVVTGTKKDSFYKEAKTKNGNLQRRCKFGLEIDEGKFLYGIEAVGNETEKVYVSKKNSEGKNETKDIDFANRFKFIENENKKDKDERWNAIGKRFGLIKNEEGKNIVETLFEYDACEYLSKNLHDGQTVFIEGKMEYNSFKDDNGNVKRFKRFVSDKIFLGKDDIDFKSDGFEETAFFRQDIVFIDIKKPQDGSSDYIVSAKIVQYNSIEDVEFVIREKALANQFGTKLKPYNRIEVSGYVEVSENVQVVEDDDNWGEDDKTKKQNAPIQLNFIITGAKGSSVDATAYTETNVVEGIKKLEIKETVEEDWGKNQTSKGFDGIDDDEW